MDFSELNSIMSSHHRLSHCLSSDKTSMVSLSETKMQLQIEEQMLMHRWITLPVS